MKPYQAVQYISLFGIFLLAAGSIVIGIAVGIAAYLISNLYYLMFLYPIGMAIVAAIAYSKFIYFAKARHPVVTAVFGMITGIIIAASFYSAHFALWRSQAVTEIQKTYAVDRGEARYVFDRFIKEETGLGGLLGFMALRARAGEEITNTLIVHNIPVFQFNVTLKSGWAWLYWLVEIILITVPTAWLSYAVSQRPFNQSVNNWYDSLPKQIGLVPWDCKEAFLSLLKSNRFQETSSMVLQEGDGPAPHPLLELYEQHNLKQAGNHLLTVKETLRADSSKVNRSVVGQWEVTLQEYQHYLHALPDEKIQPVYPEEYV